MLWQTLITIPAFPQRITYRTPVLFIGSCFASNMGEAMRQRKFPVTINPFGAAYNPQSVVQALQRLRSGKPFEKKELVCCNGLWTTFSHHSSFSHPDAAVFLQQANDALRAGQDAFLHASFVVASLGTSWAYRHKEKNTIVANCHKFPATDFERSFSPAEETARLLAKEIAAEPARTWVLTVSPVRHWKDGAHGNQLSKAHLLLAIEQLQQQFPNVRYFPAYEIMMDELRDYRFYDADMLHPSAQAVDYIWQRFSEAALDGETTTIMHEAEKIIAAQQHRPLHENTTAHRKFLTDLHQKIQDFSARYPFIPIVES
ncbi:MAG: GSCFA domain-containing protein [Prevotellaceae bacterium]|jgi:hypothetical protein|nr:GSCFA domain-containing protein [Prevotellaceae bacterium]